MRLLLLAAAFASTAGMATHDAHELRVGKLMTHLAAVNPNATRAKCEDCVNAEEALVKAFEKLEGMEKLETKAFEVEDQAKLDHSNATTWVGTRTTEVGDAAEDVETILTQMKRDLNADSPEAIMGETTPLHDKAAEWLRRQGVLKAQETKEKTLKGEMEAAIVAHEKAEGEEKEARDEKDAKSEEAEHYCAIMRGEKAPPMAIAEEPTAAVAPPMAIAEEPTAAVAAPDTTTAAPAPCSFEVKCPKDAKGVVIDCTNSRSNMPDNGINGIYTLKNPNEFVRTDGKMVILKNQRGPPGWNWCRTKHAPNPNPNAPNGGCQQYMRKGHKFASNKDGFPNEGKITDWVGGNKKDASVIEWINRDNCE